MHPYQPEFDRLMNHKKSTELLIERIFAPQKYPEFHAYLDHVHTEWIKECNTRSKILFAEDKGQREPFIRIWHYEKFLTR